MLYLPNNPQETKKRHVWKRNVISMFSGMKGNKCINSTSDLVVEMKTSDYSACVMCHFFFQNTGTVLRGAKRAQFNIFLRPITSVTATANFNNTLTPIVWLQEVSL